jgi:hypothetical protein
VSNVDGDVLNYLLTFLGSRKLRGKADARS